MPTIQPLLLMGLALPITLVAAVLSWHFVEGTALRAKQELSALKLSRLESKLRASLLDRGKPT